MQHVTDDMDDLFRRAGEHYPLHPGTPDWDKLAHALQQADATGTEKGNRNKHLLWLLLLLPLALVCNRYWNAGVDSPNTTEAPASAPNSKEATATTQAHREQSKNKTALPPLPPVAEQQTPVAALPEQKKPRRNPTTSYTPHRPVSIGAAKQTTIAAGTSTKRNVGDNNNKPVQQTVQSLSPNPYNTTGGKDIPLLAGTTQNGWTTDLHASATFDTAQQVLRQSRITHQQPSPAQGSGFYAGIMGGADITSVELQRVSRVGWQTGLLAGYHLGKRWRAESGVYLTRKYYFTQGEYIKGSGIYQSPNAVITEADGYCTMVEVPLNIRYELASRAKGSWFAVAGISSYFMKKEAYDLLYYYRNSGNYVVHSKTYDNATTNLFSVLNLGGGYECRLGRATSLRVEPYLKLPLNGLGYGKMQFSSTGVNLGLIRRF